MKRKRVTKTKNAWQAMLLPIVAGVIIGILTSLIMRFMGGHIGF